MGSFNPKVVGSNPTGGIEKWLEFGRGVAVAHLG
jgi:hypothetical protein